MITLRIQQPRGALKVLILLLTAISCLKLSHAQAPPAPAAAQTPATSPGVGTTPNPAAQVNATGAPGAALNSILNSAQPPIPPGSTVTVGKYEEYQSVCRNKDFDSIYYYSDKIKDLRIGLIKDRLSKNPESTALLLRLLKEFIDQKKTKEAEALMTQLKTKKISKADQQIADSILSFSKGDKKSARTQLNALLVEDPKNTVALKLLAEVYLAESNYFESASIFFDLGKFTGKHFDEELCESYTLDGHYAEAEEYCFKEIARTKNPLPYIYLGIANREQKKYKEAKKYFLSSVKIKESEMGYLCLGEIYSIEINNKEASASFEKAIATMPKSDRAHTALAWNYFNDNKREQALQQFQMACALNPKVVVEIRRSLKKLIDEKSEKITAYSQLLQKCEAM